MPAVKEKTTLEVLIEERKKEAVEKIAPKIVDLVSSTGIRTPFGFKLERDGAIFDYNELSDNVIVSLGANEMFAVNLRSKRCSLYKNGSWVRIFAEAQRAIEGRDPEDLKQKHGVKFRENFGILGI